MDEKIMLDKSTLNSLVMAFKGYGITAREAAEGMSALAKSIPSLSEEDIIRIKSNPSLSWISKLLLIRKIKKQLKRNKND